MTNKLEKIVTIEQQIEKLKERQKKIEEQMHIGIGREVLKLWNVESEEAIKWVQKMASQVNGVESVRSREVSTNEI
ncbi:hypothetical protein C7437_11715 [Psychrobacillus insolitus]|uniref:Uncharacterized protein n=1 Tax=Psychrobacillus insolitus TaxID=1461 RepID=A0A2W7MB68_9BACI|nr:hypothetical protein [Psychrobacillus insolitus]PZX01273.1 hypothetical protein C7437_11715 [Psychrobacillus insolitus]